MSFHPPHRTNAPSWLPRLSIALLGLGVVADLLVRLGVEVLWFRELEASQVLRAHVVSQVLLGVVGFVLALAVLWANVGFAWRGSQLPRVGPRGQILPPPRQARRLAFLAVTAVAVMMAGALAARWLDYRLAIANVPYGLADPIFGRDVAFHLFRLPALRALTGWGLGLVITTGIATALAYAARGVLVGPRGFAPAPLRHLGMLGGAAMAILAALVALGQFDILHSPGGAVYGPGYSEVTAKLRGTRFTALVMLVAAVLLAIAAWRGRPRLAVGAAAGVAISWFVFVVAIPSLVQKLVVEPNELVKEKPYIEQAIRMTREAYDLNAIEAHPFEINRRLDAETVAANRGTIDNIRLWDWRPLLATYGQIQEIRLYYNFGDVDIDRYVIGGQLRQVMLSARELAYDQIPEGARTWVNLHLKYTHGYGLCMSPVNRRTSEGLPELWVRDIPPASPVGIEIRRPEIYYGEQTSAFSLVGTSTDEFDYPLGETNQSTRYSGRGGISVGSLGRRLLFAWYLRSRELLFTSYVTPESRILMRRSLQERVVRIAPFLRYDRDPYMVIDEGRLFWIQDAYTASNRFPGSRPVGGLNYIRNSVKVVIDAYEGTTRFYAAQPDDPVLRRYAAVFPGLFRPLSELSEGLRAHLRYPEDLFEIQAEAYGTYHMQDAQVFYNREDLWSRPIENVGGRETPVEPYYTITRLPNGEGPELVLMLPFTPARKDNMVAWLAARCDGEHLGKRQVYLFPKQELVYGPRQIEARIDQEPAVSQVLTLWNQHGSNVIRGNLLVMPIGEAILYVEPLYLQADKGALPELKRVILAHADRIVMEPDLETALSRLIGSGVARDTTASAPGTPGAPSTPGVPPVSTNTAQRALDLMRQAEEAVQRGDWLESGRAMQELRTFLESSARQSGRN